MDRNRLVLGFFDRLRNRRVEIVNKKLKLDPSPWTRLMKLKRDMRQSRSGANGFASF
jgi:hypothetical protein